MIVQGRHRRSLSVRQPPLPVVDGFAVACLLLSGLLLSGPLLLLPAAPEDSPGEDCVPWRRLPVLKSVSYQPPPFRRKLLADTSRDNPSPRQAGQVFRGASFIFCRASSRWPHSLH